MKIVIILSILLTFSQAEVIELKPIEVTASSLSDAKEESLIPPNEEVETVVVIQETVPGFENPVVNGLMGDKVLLTVDGIKFSNSLFRSGPNQYYSWIPKEFTTKAELNSNLSGITSSALGGAINRELGIDESVVGVSADFTDHKEYIKYKDKKVSFGLLNDNRQNVTTPKGTIEHSAYNQHGAYFEHKDEELGQTKLVFTQSNDVDRTDKFEKGEYYVYDLQQYFLLSHKYYIPDTDLAILPSFQQFKERIDRNSPTNKDTDSTNNMFGIQLLGYYEPSWTDDGYFSYGVVNNFEDIEYESGLVTNNYNYNTLSLYTTYHTSYKKLDYDLKYKYSVMTARGGGLDRTLDNHSVGIDSKYRLGYRHSIFAGANLNYKFPTITNLAEARDDSVTEIANPNLKQERAYTLTLGYNFEYFTTSIFHKKLYDMIIREETNIPDGSGAFKWKYQNTDEGYINGVNVKYDRKFSNGFGVFLFAEYLDGKTDYDYISKLVPFHTKSKVSYKPFYAELLYAPSVSDNKMAEKDKQDIRIKDHNYGYRIINIGYERTFKKVHDIGIQLDNVLDETGRVYGSSVDFGERGLYFTYQYHY